VREVRLSRPPEIEEAGREKEVTVGTSVLIPRLIEFGGFAAERRQRPCGKFQVQQKTRRVRMRAKAQDDQRGDVASGQGSERSEVRTYQKTRHLRWQPRHDQVRSEKAIQSWMTGYGT
jgi:hypothetical protein